jgi:GntR family transcriptional regulator, transcriptional repressor for pyruvate dehydrogenase complex
MENRRFTPVRQSRVSEEVAAQLKQSILVGEFRAGDKLPAERELVEEFRVSRTAVREALRVLENTGFVATRQGAGGGAFVTDLNFEYLGNAFLDLFLTEKISIPELHQVRLLVEPEVSLLAAKNVTPEYAARLKKSLEAEKRSGTSLAEDMKTKTAVHVILAEMCGNRFLEAIVRSAMRLTLKVIVAVNPGPPYMHPSGMHTPVIKAVLAGDEEAAFNAMKKHAIEFGNMLMKMENDYREKQHQAMP